MNRSSFIVLVALIACSGQPGDARLWKPSPQQQAQDYGTIVHNKGSTDGRVSVTWLAPPGFSGTAQQLFEKYVVITITHVLPTGGGLPEYQDIEGVEVTDEAGNPLKPVNPDQFPPNLVSMFAGADAVLKQTTQGRGKVKNLVFEAGPVRACEKNSGLIVVFEGEKYTWDAPIPGCPPVH